MFHCLIVKEFGEQVHEAIVFNLEYGRVSLFIKKLNAHFHYRVKEDRRVDETTFIEDDYSLVVSFRVPLKLSSSIRKYEGTSDLNQSKIKQKKIKEEAKHQKEAATDGSQPAAEQDLESYNCLLKVFDKVMVKLQTTDTFPLDFKIKMLLTQEDMEEYAAIKEAQDKKFEELAQMTLVS